MNEKAILHAIILIPFIFCACTKQPVGKWHDVIQLSTKEVTLKATEDSTLITAKGKWWQVSAVSLNSQQVDTLSSRTGDACSFTYADSIITIVTKSCDTLFVKMNANHTGSERNLVISFMAGDYYDGVKIIQTKN